MSAILRKKINDSFPKTAREDALQYMEWLRSSMSEVTASMRRSGAIILLLASVFELVVDSQKLEISVASFEISSGLVVLVFIPAVISYLYLQITTDGIRLLDLHALFGSAFSNWSPGAAREGLHAYILPPLTMYLNIGTTPVYTDRVLNRVQDVSKNASIGLMLMGVPVFTGIAYWQLYIKHIDRNIPWFASLFTALIFAVAAITYFLGFGGERSAK